MFNRSRIMQRAWVWAKQDLWSKRLPPSRLRGLFVAALSRAWAEAKAMAARIAEPPKFAAMAIADLRAAIIDLENRDRLGFAGLTLLTEYSRALSYRMGAAL